MKNALRYLVLCAPALLSACAAYQAPLELQLVGPTPAREAASLNKGYLIVYSAWNPLGNDQFRDHSDYKILSTSEALVQRVRNARYYGDEEPVRVSLPGGVYKVLAPSRDAGKVLVPVLIKPGQTTALYLDGSVPTQSKSSENEKLVKLPNGQVVGPAAAAAINR